MAATAHRIDISVGETGLLGVPQRDESAIKVTELLERDLKEHHVFFNARGYHNHIVHHLLALYGTGASPNDLAQAYVANTSYQVPAKSPDAGIVQELKRGWGKDCAYLGKGDHYPDFLQFFQDEIDAKGWEAVLSEYVLGDDERSHTMTERLFAGLLHPMIQVMCGIEWNQPAIVAEGLAQAAAHDNLRSRLLSQIEERAEERAAAAAAASGPRPVSGDGPAPSIPELFESIRRNERLANAVHDDDPDRISAGFSRAGDDFFDLLSRVRVDPSQVDQKAAEMLHTMVYVTAATAFHAPHLPRWDFFFLHHLNASPFFVSINRLASIPARQKARLLEWKIRFDLIQYIAQGAPPLDLESVLSQPLPLPLPRDDKDKNHAVVAEPGVLFPRYHKIVDDGHTIKAARSLLIAQELSKRYPGEPWIRLRDDEAWLRVHSLLLRGAEAGAPRWVFGVGFGKAWENVPVEV